QKDATGAQLLFGSPAYMSPEQARCEELDQRSDLYSLGVTLYEALTGELPISAPSIGEHLIQLQTESPKPLSQIVPDLDPLLEDIVGRLLAKEPLDRHNSAREVRAELQELAALLSSNAGLKVETLDVS